VSSVWLPVNNTSRNTQHKTKTQLGLKVADLQEQSAANRKQLADATREFKRSTAGEAADSEYVQAVAALLKRYQEEIDALTRRAKHGAHAVLRCADCAGSYRGCRWLQLVDQVGTGQLVRMWSCLQRHCLLILTY
jgi:hypothetical protein